MVKNMWTKDLIVKKDTDQYPFWRFWSKERITREDGADYLNRITIIGIGKWFSIKFHNVVQSDDACLHCHPWSFISIILKGGYWEHTYVEPIIIELAKELGVDDEMLEELNIFPAPDGKYTVRKFYKPGSILWRRAPSIHKLELNNDKNGKPIPCNTLIFTGKVFRKWGFYTKSGFIYWRDYTKKLHC